MNIISWDKIFFLFINNFAGEVPILDSTVKLVVNEYFVPVTLALVILYIWFKKDKVRIGARRVLVIAALSVGLVNLIIQISNAFIIRARPFETLDVSMLFYKPTDPSFPSNAAAVGFALATSIFLVNKKLGVISFLLASFYGFSRVYAGVHFPGDVLVGAIVGIVSVLIVSCFKNLINLFTIKIEKIQTKLKLELK